MIPSLTFSFIPCLEGCTVRGNKNRLSHCIQAAASSLFALLFAGKSLNSAPRAGLFPRATRWTGVQSCGQRLSAVRLEPLGCLQHKPPWLPPLLNRSLFGPISNPGGFRGETLGICVGCGLNHCVLLLLM